MLIIRNQEGAKIHLLQKLNSTFRTNSDGINKVHFTEILFFVLLVEYFHILRLHTFSPLHQYDNLGVTLEIQIISCI